MRHPKFKTEEERKASRKKAYRRFYKKNRNNIREYQRKYKREKYKEKKEANGIVIKQYRKRNKGKADIQISDVMLELISLKEKYNDIMKDHEELLVKHKKLENLIKWGKK